MPRKTANTSPVTIYPSHKVAAQIVKIAEAERRSVSSQILKWVEDELKKAEHG